MRSVYTAQLLCLMFIACAKIAHCQVFFVKDCETALRGNHATTDVILMVLFVYHVVFNLCLRIISENVYHFR